MLSGLFVGGGVCYKARNNVFFAGLPAPPTDKGLSLWLLNVPFLSSSQMPHVVT